MTQYRILLGQEEHGPYSEQQLKSMYAAGSITMDAYYWTEGMEEWHPIAELSLDEHIQGLPPLPAAQIPIKEKPKGDCISTLAKGLVAFIGLAVIIGIFASSFHSPEPAKPQTPTATDKARAIVTGANPVMASTHKGFLTIDRALTNNYPSNKAAENAADLLLSATVVNKLLSAISEQELIEIYTEWCKQTNHTSYTQFPEFVEMCKKGEVKGMTDALTKELTK